MSTILPDGSNNISVTPNEVLRYLNTDGLRQLLRNERLRWNLKVNKDSDFYSKHTMFKYSGDVHNEGDHQRMDVRAFPDNGSNPGYAGMYVDGGEFGMVHNNEKWDNSLSEQSKKSIVPRVEIGAMTKHLPNNPLVMNHEQITYEINPANPNGPLIEKKTIAPKHGHGMNSSTGKVEEYSVDRSAYHVYDAHDGRVYTLSNDEATYVNNKNRDPYKKLPDRTAARVVDIPVDLNDLDNTSNMVNDWDYHHGTNDFNHSHRYILDNIDDRTFVTPEISKDSAGNYVANQYMGLAGSNNYAEGDGSRNTNIETGSTNSYNKNKDWVRGTNPNNTYNTNGYFPGVFRSIEELEKVDLLRQRRTVLTHAGTPSGRRRQNYYQFDGMWEHNAFSNGTKVVRATDPNLPINAMESINTANQPYPYSAIQEGGSTNYQTSQLYQWRYNRVSIYWYSTDIQIAISNGGAHYKVGDILRYNFLNKWIYYRVTHVGVNDTIIGGKYILPTDPNHPNINHSYVKFEHNPSTNNVPVVFKNQTSSGRGATFVIACPSRFEATGSQLKNNLYAYVDVVPTVASDNSSPWSDTTIIPSNDNHFTYRSTAPVPGHTGINRGRGGMSPTDNSADTPLYEHSGNATAGPHIHLFRYIIDTGPEITSGANQNVTVIDGTRVRTGRWVDQGPMGLERPADVKALYLSNQDTNNFNNYYKFFLDMMIDMMYRNGDNVITNNSSSLSQCYFTIAQKDPWEQPVGQPNLAGPSQATLSQYISNGFTVANGKLKVLRPLVGTNGTIIDHQAYFDKRIDPTNGSVSVVEITNKVLYLNAATRVLFAYNSEAKLDSTYGYGQEPPGWLPIAGTIGR